MPPIGWTPEGTATWQAANAAMQQYFAESTSPPCPWCYGQGGFFQWSNDLRNYVRVLCEGCFGTRVWVSGTDAKH